MKLSIIISLFYLFLSPHIKKPDTQEVLGSWQRKSDDLIILVASKEDLIKNKIESGRKACSFQCKAPSKVFELNSNEFDCAFLVFDVESLSNDKNVRINENNELEIKCKGLDTQYFRRIEPRFK